MNRGTVTGSVYDGETRTPIRFAAINLVPFPPTVEDRSEESPQKRAQRVEGVSGTSDMDGNFLFKEIPEGDYLIVAFKIGYVSPISHDVLTMLLSEDQLKSLASSLQQVHISASGVASVSIVLHRGAALTGRLRFADGSPIVGVHVEALSADLRQHLKKSPRPQNAVVQQSLLLQTLTSLLMNRDDPRTGSGIQTSDDEGRYRVVGLSPGKYLVGASLFLTRGDARVRMNYGTDPKGSMEHPYPQMIPVFAPATFRIDDAKAFDVVSNEEIPDVDLTIDTSGVHSIRGHVLAGDHHAPVSMIQLKEVGEGQATRMIEVEDDGAFEAKYVPPGNYIMEIHSYDSPSSQPPQSSGTEYKRVRLRTIVTDHDVLLNEILVVPLKPGEHNDYSPLP